MLNLVKLYDLPDFPFKMKPIIGDDFLWYSKSTDDVVLYESGHMLGFQNRIGGAFYLFSKVVNCNQNVLLSIKGLGSCPLNRIYAPYRKRPWRGHIV